MSVELLNNINDPDEESTEVGKKLATEFLKYLETGKGLNETDHSMIDIEDVKSKVNRLYELFKISSFLELPIPCLNIDDHRGLPLDILPSESSFLPFSHNLTRSEDQYWSINIHFLKSFFEVGSMRKGKRLKWYEIWETASYKKGGVMGMNHPSKLIFLNFNEIKESIHNNISAFLARRHYVVKNANNANNDSSNSGSSYSTNSPPSTNKKNKFYTTVNTSSNNLEIVFSPVFFISWSYFGSPSSPVKNHLNPGNYVFGSINSNNVVLKTSPKVSIPAPRNTVNLNSF
jgi:hypothetical protein